jgi:dimethylaniline monooxygenase (N-oxide forming)
VIAEVSLRNRRGGRRGAAGPARPRVCLVGAGASGITTARSLSKQGIPFDWFDKGDRVGGIWVFESASGLSSSYRQLHINVSRERIEFADRPMPRSLPVYPHHTHVAAYFDDYVRHFGLDAHLRLRTEVTRATRRDDGLWEVELDSGERRLYDALVSANGHHSRPRWPQPAPPGEFAGEQIHSHDYREDSVLRDRDVVVVGFGNSACDIAVESSFVARRTYLSVRRGAHVLPKTIWRWPYDQVPGQHWALGMGLGVGRFGVQLPRRARQLILETPYRMTVGRMELYGLPKPDHPFGAAHHTISPRLLERLLRGEIAPKPKITKLDGEMVHFADGSAARADLIVWCTGYEIGFSFLDPRVMPVAENNRVDLYWNVFSPRVPNLACVGLVQPATGSTMQISEAQGRWVAAYLAGEYALPAQHDMWLDIERQRRELARQYVTSARHTVQVSQFELLWELRHEMHRGRLRARRSGPAVRARAAELDPAAPATVLTAA